MNTNAQDIFDKVKANQLELAYASASRRRSIRTYTYDRRTGRTPPTRSTPVTAPGTSTMNLTTPPFDDIHVRKAVNLVMDKEGLRRVWGGPLRGEIARHVLPDSMVDDLLADYDPYPTEGDAGDSRRPRRDEAVQVRHGRGRHVRRGRVQGGPARQRHATALATWRRSSRTRSAKIGIDGRRATTTRTRSSRPWPTRSRSLGARLGQGLRGRRDLHGPLRLAQHPGGGQLEPLARGAHRRAGEQARGRGHRRGRAQRRRRHRRCNVLRGDERTQCWADLDKKLMEEVVPWVPYLDATPTSVRAPRSPVRVRPVLCRRRPTRTSRSTRRSSRNRKKDRGGPPVSGRPPTRFGSWQAKGRREAVHRPDGSGWVVVTVALVTLLTFVIFFVLPTGRPRRPVRRQASPREPP